MPEIIYQRLTYSRGRSTFAVAFRSRASLWLGPDHLLCVDTNGYSETYKRFYFRDIQAIAFHRTKRYQWWNVIVGFFALAFLIFTVAIAPKTSPAQWTGDEIAGGIALGTVTGLCMLLLLTNYLYGPTCKCFLRTAVQIEDLPSLCRVPRTRKVLATIRPLITAAQGSELPAETVAARMRDWATALPVELAANPVPDEPNVPPRLAP